MNVVLRLLRGDRLEILIRALGIEAHRIAAWRDELRRFEGGLDARLKRLAGVY